MTAKAESAEKIRVAVFQGHGGSRLVWETMAALEMDSLLECSLLTTKQLNSGALQEIDVLVVPGGGGSRQYLNMEESGRRLVQDFVAKGGVAMWVFVQVLTSSPIRLGMLAYR